MRHKNSRISAKSGVNVADVIHGATLKTQWVGTNTEDEDPITVDMQYDTAHVNYLKNNPVTGAAMNADGSRAGNAYRLKIRVCDQDVIEVQDFDMHNYIDLDMGTANVGIVALPLAKLGQKEPEHEKYFSRAQF